MNVVKYRFAILRVLGSYAYGVRKHFAALAVVNILSISLSFIIPVFYKIFVDKVIVERHFEMMLIVFAGYLGCNILGMVFGFLQRYFENILQRWTMFKIKHRLLEIYFALPFTSLWKRNVGDLKMRIDDDTERLMDFTNSQTIDFVKTGITAAVSAGMLLLTDWRLAIFALFAVPLTLLLDRVISSKEKKLIKINRENADGWQDWLLSSIQGWKTIKSLNLQKKEMIKFISFAHNYALFFSRWINYWVARTAVIPKIKDEFLMRFAVYFLGGLLIMNGNLTIGKLLVFVMYFDLMSKSVKTFSTLNADLRSNAPLYDRVLNELAGADQRIFEIARPAEDGGRISFRNLSFSYDGVQSVISNFNEEIYTGERVAITGKSGVGKTTLLKLIMGMLVPGDGEILFNGENVAKISPKYLYSKIGIIMQESILFNLSIRENLQMACAHADQVSLDNVCKIACIDDFIRSLPDGYDTIIGERGVKLSGGQRQRIVLARLLLRNVDVIIFDEATSSLDQQSEMAIYDTLKMISHDKTIIVVAHRQSSISFCDRQIVMA